MVEGDRAKRRLAAIVAADVVGFSRLVGTDEEGTLARLKALRRDLVDPRLSRHSGRIFKTTGDGLLMEFSSAVDAIRCVLDLQRALAQDQETQPENRRLRFRIGVHVGDVVVDGNDILGDGVNVAARLEQLAEPGGVCISRSANEQIRDKLALTFADLGEHTVKNISRAIGVFALRPEDIEALPEDQEPQAPDSDRPERPAHTDTDHEQEIRFCTSTDGTRLAYSRMGSGPPLVKTGNWMTHLEYDLESPIWRHLYRDLARDHTLVRYDARCNGLSDRGVDDISFDAFVMDLEAVVDAAELGRFALFGVSQGCAVSVAYAARHPERVTHLALFGGFALGANKRAQTDGERERNVAMATLMRHGWGQDNPAFRQLFTSQFIPGGTKEQADWFNELQRQSQSPDDAARYLKAPGDIDVTGLLSNVTVPTLVMHARGDARVPFDAGRQLAAGIPGAKFVPLQSQNHLILEHEPAFSRFMWEMSSFLQS